MAKNNAEEPQKIKASQAADSSSNDNALEVVFLRNNFYSDHYRHGIILVGLLIFAIISQIALTAYIQFTREHDVSFATTHDKKLLRLVPLNQQNMTNEALLGWVKDAAVASYTFNFVNWKEALGEVRQYYTATGYQHFLKVLKDSGSLDDVRIKKMVVTAVPIGAPVINKEGLINQAYSWQIQIPLTLIYQGITEGTRQDITMTMLVTRVSNLESEKGIGIAQLLVTENKRMGQQRR
ncbi:MAG: DotI/IcmL/TraM family protein [Gammaproteobacteria bacterium]